MRDLEKNTMDIKLYRFIIEPTYQFQKVTKKGFLIKTLLILARVEGC